jgi:hypothetical protein
MTHLLTRILPHTELIQLFESAEAQDFLRLNSQKTKGNSPFLYNYVSNDDPTEDLAVVWIFPGPDTVWVDLLVFGDVQYIPSLP